MTRGLWLAIFALFFTNGTVSFAQEGVDLQTPDEIARAHEAVARDFANEVLPHDIKAADRAAILERYANVDPNHEVPSDLLATALVYYDANKASFPNQNYFVVVNFKPRSDQYRFFLVSLFDGSVEKYHTTHGAGSDKEKDGFAKVFGNVINSGMSSLGFVRTAEVYDGTYKHALRLDGLSNSNSNMRDRAVVFHGWDGVHEANVVQGLSLGCITLDWKVKDSVLDKIKEGALIYVGVTKK